MFLSSLMKRPFIHFHFLLFLAMLHIVPCVSKPVIFLNYHFSRLGSARGLQRCCFPLICLFPCNEAPRHSDRCTQHLPAPPGGEGMSLSKTYGHLQGCGSAGVWAGRWKGLSLECCSCKTFGAIITVIEATRLTVWMKKLSVFPA